jgi:hypothetical protein
MPVTRTMIGDRMIHRQRRVLEEWKNHLRIDEDELQGSCGSEYWKHRHPECDTLWFATVFRTSVCLHLWSSNSLTVTLFYLEVRADNCVPLVLLQNGGACVPNHTTSRAGVKESESSTLRSHTTTVWYLSTELHSVTCSWRVRILYLTDGGMRFLRVAGRCLPNCRVSHPKRTQS